jgi:nucleoside-diphosphate-sugar epimerase
VTIVRPVPVFGPRDRDFFTYFDLVNWRLSLQLGQTERRISLIYIRDLVEVLLLALESAVAVGQTYIACSEAHSYSEFSDVIATALNKRTLRIVVPLALLTPMALWAKIQGRLTGRPALLNEQRIIDMRQPYWLYTAEKAHRELGFVPRYDLETAVQETANWYQENGWL